MKVVIQRVSKASVTANGKQTGQIGHGLMILVGFENNDNEEDILWLSAKISKLRIFDDKDGVMNLSVQEINGEILVVSQFTLHASTKKGNRPSYIKAARPETAIPLYERFKKQLSMDCNTPVANGIFGADMQIELINDGPVTIIIDTKNKD